MVVHPRTAAEKIDAGILGFGKETVLERIHMQPPPIPESSSITYQMPRDVLIRIWWRRMMLRPRILIWLSFDIVLAIACFILGGGAEIAAYFLLGVAIAGPVAIYRGLAKAIDTDPAWTDLKTLEFGSSRLVSTGPNWKNEIPWTRFQGFSEDPAYFYLHIADNGLASVIPKNAFTPDQQQSFREYAKTRNAS